MSLFRVWIFVLILGELTHTLKMKRLQYPPKETTEIFEQFIVKTGAKK